MVAPHNLLHLLPPHRSIRGHAPWPPLLRQRRQQQMDGHSRPIRRLPSSPPSPALLPPTETPPPRRAEPSPPLAAADLPGFRRPPHRRQLDVLLRPPLPPGLHLFLALRYPIGLQRRLLLLPQQPEVHPVHPQLPRPPHRLRHPPRRQFRRRRHRFHRRQEQVRNRIPHHRRRLRRLLPLPLPHPAHLRQPRTGESYGEGGGGDADLPISGGDGRLCGGDFCERGVEGGEGGDEGLYGGESGVLADADLDGGGVAGVVAGDVGVGVRGIVSVFERDQHFGAAVGSGAGGGAVRG
ncbi:unnamed protein product [Linum tenue]|uniref:Uncharacterized protein n=1 Tax=Linum tenue TaxID=586396 RepID=A0AAV0KBC0_9ROSI|nr:unnamed protein product [Linum tenue]